MHKPRKQKIKRYRNSFSGKAERGLIIRRVLGFVVLLAILFCAGWFLAEPAINFVSGLWYSVKDKLNNKSDASSSSDISSSASQSIPESTPQSDSTPPTEPVKELQNADGNWANVAFSAVDTLDKAEETAKDLAAQGVKCAVLQLKDERGYIYYQSAVPFAKKQIAGNTLDAAQTAKIFADNGIVPIAGIYAFKDGLASRENRDAAVTYNGQEGYLWLDNKPELGGSSWLSPYAEASKNYINDLISELTAFGFKQVIVSGAQYPDGYGLETAVFASAEDTRTKQQALTDCVAQWTQTAAANDAQLWLEYPAEVALDDENKKTYASPFSLGAECMLINFSKSAQAEQTESTIGKELFDAVYSKAAQFNSPKLAMTAGGLLSSDAAYAAAAAAKEAGFVSFVVQ